jgi:hypothetical protein
MLTMAILVSACANDTTEEMPSIPTDASGVDDNHVPVHFSVSEQHVFDITRSATSIITFNANEVVKVFVKPDGEENYVDYDFTAHESGRNVALDPPAIPPFFPAGNGSTVQAYAYYPASATTLFSVQDDQTSDANYKLSDLMFASNRIVTKDGTDGNEVLTMNHQMAQLRITANPQIGSGLNIATVEVEAKKSVTFTPEAETIITTTGDPGSITALNAAGTGYIVIPPQEIEGIVIRVKTGAGTAAETATYLFHSTGSFAAGSSYGINLTVTDEQLGTTSFINDWTGNNSVNVTPSGDRDLVILPIGAQELEYTGYSHEPDVSVYHDGVYVNASDYTRQYVNNTDAGRAYIIVVGKNGTDIEGCVGIASFTIAQANAEISYASDTETKTYGNPKFTKPLTNTGDGAVTYTSSNPEVASVNATTGEVTILKGGETTITATVENGANFVYKSDKKTASYTLTVNSATGTITFGSANPIKTWSATSANNTFTQNVTNSGTGPVTYEIGNVNTCGATINGSTVSFTQSGIVIITATVEDDECYTYAVKSANYVLTVNKATGFVNLTANSGIISAGKTTVITVNTSHGGTLSAVATSGAIDRITSITGPVSNKFTVSTNGTTPTSVTIAVSCDATEQYNAATTTYTLTIDPAKDIKKLPLYYMSEAYVAKADGSLFGATAGECYYFNWYDAMTKFAAQTTSYANYRTAGKGPGNRWHLPIQKEWWGIVPSIDANFWNYSTAGTWRNGYIQPIWGYNNTTKNPGVLESSYIRKFSSNEIRAIRFLGTEFCSAWRYVMGNNRLTIYATLIETVANNKQAAESWYNSNFNSVYFGNNEAEGAVQRELYECGHTDFGQGSTGNKPVNNSYGRDAYHQSATIVGNGEWTLFHASNHVGKGPHAYVFSCADHRYGFTVRLFRDN